VKRKRLHIILFAWLQLMVFVTPMVIKLAHHHEANSINVVQTTQKTLVKDNEQCPICHFEFVNFISENNEKPDYVSQNIAILLTSGQTRKLLNAPNQYHSNRAPPQSIA